MFKKYILANFLCMRSSLLEPVLLTWLEATEAYNSIDMARARHISRLPVVEKENA
jgi:hypothetical protein